MLNLGPVTCIAANGFHLGFTSLVQWHGFCYVAYRQAQSHNPYPPGHVVIQRSEDLKTWEPVTILRTGGDDRDPHLVTSVDKLYCLWGTYVPYYDAWTGRTSLSGSDIYTYGAWSHDGMAWGPPYRIARPASWLWNCVMEPARFEVRTGVLTRVMGRKEATVPMSSPWYGVSYDVGDGQIDKCHTLTLWRGTSPLLWERWASMIGPASQLSDLQPSEPALFWKDTETLGCVVRTEKAALYGEASRPFIDWRWQEITGVGSLHAPAVLHVPGVGWIVAGRNYVPGKKRMDKPVDVSTMIWQFDTEKALVHHGLQLPSDGDCSYPGLAWDTERQEVLCSYYSQHERDTKVIGMPHAADIYLARLTVGA